MIIEILSKYLRGIGKIFKSLFWLIIGFVFLGLIIIHLPFSQSYLTKNINSFIASKLSNRTEVGSVSFNLLGKISIKDVYVEDQKNDTLLYSESIEFKVGVIDLISKKISISNVDISNTIANISRSLPDSIFNFDYIVKAFSGNNPQEIEVENPENTSSFDFALSDIHLKSILFNYFDEVDGLDMGLKLGNLALQIDKFELADNNFQIGSVNWENTSGYFKQFKSSTPKDDTVTSQFVLGMDNVSLQNIDLVYADKTSDQEINIRIGDLFIEDHFFNLMESRLNFAKVKLDNSKLEYSVLSEKEQGKTDSKVPGKTPSQDWKISVGEIDFKNNEIVFDNNSHSKTLFGFDSNHFGFTNVDVDVSGVSIYGSLSKAVVNNISFKEKKGFELLAFKSEFNVTETYSEISKLHLQTPESNISFEGTLGYESLTRLMETIAENNIDFNIPEAEISVTDLLYFIPEMENNTIVKNNNHEKITIKGDVNGKIGDLNIGKLRIKTANSTIAEIKGKIRGLPKSDNLFFDFTDLNIHTNAKDIYTLLPTAFIPEGIAIPENIVLKCNAKGNQTDFLAGLKLATSYGGLVASVGLVTALGNESSYTSKVEIQNFNMGKLLKNTQDYGIVDLSGNIKGLGFNPDSLIATADFLIHRLDYNKYAYKNITLNGSIQNSEITTGVNINDPNLILSINADVNISPKHTSLIYSLNLEKVGLKPLNFSKDDIEISLKSSANLKGNNIDNLNGKAETNEIKLTKNNKTYLVEELGVSMFSEGNSNMLKIYSDFLSAQLEGNISISKLGNALNEHFKQYFSKNDFIAKPDQEQKFNFYLNVLPSPFISEVLLPELKSFDSFVVSGNYNSDEKALNLNAYLPSFIYQDILFDSVMLRAFSDYDSLHTSLIISEIESSNVLIDNLKINSSVARDIITSQIILTDSLNRNKLFIGNEINRVNNVVELKIFPLQLILNYEKWNIHPDNYLRIEDKKIVAENFLIRNQQKAIELKTIKNGIENNDLTLSFSNFNLSNLSKLIEKQSPIITGIVDGQVTQHYYSNESPKFESDLTVKDLSYLGDTIGNVVLKVFQKPNKTIELEGLVSGNQNNITIIGKYNTEKNSSDPIDVNILIRSLDMSSIESFTSGQLTSLSGKANGVLHVKGNLDRPLISGKLNFEKTGFNLSYLNSFYTIDKQSLVLKPGEIDFNSFVLNDSLGNSAILNGKINTANTDDVLFDISGKAKNFKVLNTTAEDNELYYGKMFIDADFYMKGSTNQPEIKANVRLLKSSELTFVVPPKSASEEERKGVVEFVNAVKSNQTDTTNILIADSINSGIQGLNMIANVEIDKVVPIKIIIDPIAGDNLLVEGNAIASFSIDPGGNISLAGRYEIEKGSYRLSFYNYIKKEFNIRKGSSITWTGNPMDANLDITATYLVKTSPIPLVESQIKETTMDNQNSDIRNLPFEVNLNIRDKLISPILSFNIDLPDEEKGAMGGAVYTKLQQLNESDSELNKQVFGLLMFNNFIPQNPLDIGAGGGISSTARSSVSKFLTQQLNVLSGQYIKGVDVSFELESYEAIEKGEAAGRTDLQVELSKQLFNERVKVQLGSDIPIEKGKQNQQITDFAGDIIVEYKITPDGRFLIKGFRQKEFESVLDGELIETGVSVIYTKDYDKIKGLFRTKKIKKPELEQ